MVQNVVYGKYRLEDYFKDSIPMSFANMSKGKGWFDELREYIKLYKEKITDSFVVKIDKTKGGNNER